MNNFELVYLWVEEYKNIKGQGFNFSPKYECNYTKKSDELFIKSKKYNTSIFPAKINITAIVGENGSGKSSILELLFTRYNEEKVLFIFVDKDKKEFLLLGTMTPLKIIETDASLKEFNLKYMECLPNTKAIYYSSILNKNDLYLQNFFVPTTYTHTVNISTSHLLSQMKLIETNLQGGWKKSNTGFDKLYRSFEIQQIQNAIILIQDKVVNIPFELPNKIVIQNINFKSFIENIKDKFNNKNYKKILEVIERSNDSQTIFKNYLSTNLVISLLLENINSNNPIVEELINIVLDQKMTNSLEDFYINVKNRLYRHEFTFEGELVNAQYIDSFFDFADEILHALDGIGNSKENGYTLELTIKDTDFTFLKSYEKLIQQSEYFWDINWRGLSSGEENFLYQFSRLYNLKNSFKNDPYKNLVVGNGIAQNLIILIDEGEVTLHPEWQKKYIHYLVEFLNNNFSQNIHLILTTHSPFILSDIPKQNLVFIENGKQADIDIDTFGANIHTLLAHGFFMNNSLIGEFAKNKIQEVINILNEESPNLNNKKIVNSVIKCIGEPFLKNKLQEMYDRVFLDDVERNEKIKTLEREIEKLKNVDNSQE